MARPLKIGLEYFPMDTIMDSKVKKLEAVFKNDGFTWIVKFWQEAYQVENGELSLDGYHGVFLADNARITVERQSELLTFCLEIGLIYKASGGGYSSRGVQKRIQKINSDRERWRKKYEKEVIPVDKGGITRQSKVKESKVKNKRYLPISNLLKTKILAENSEARISDTQLENWSDDVRLMVEVDKRTVEKIELGLNWVFSDDFWQNHIRSMSGFRKKWNEGKFKNGKKGQKEWQNEVR